jgi:hypothetical protein
LAYCDQKLEGMEKFYWKPRCLTKREKKVEWHYLIILNVINEKQNIHAIVARNIFLHVLPSVLISLVFHRVTQTDRMTCPLLVASSVQVAGSRSVINHTAALSAWTVRLVHTTYWRSFGSTG